MLKVLLCALLAIFLAGCEATKQVGARYATLSYVPLDADPPPKVIFVTIDGTANNFMSRTNAARLFEMVDARTVRDDGRQVVTYYAEGVGGDGGIMGGLIGAGMKLDVVNAYEFLTEVYREGDEIYLAGFSRGAYAVRALSGMVAIAGIPELNGLHPDARRQFIEDIHDAYKQDRPHGREMPTHNLTRHLDIVEIHRKYQIPTSGDYFETPIRAMAIWDTVAAMGLPDKTENPVEEERDYLMTTCHVEHVFHALSLDDNRAYSWTPLLVDGEANRRSCPKPDSDEYAAATESLSAKLQAHIDTNLSGNAIPQGLKTKVEEVWFAGAHADVGGSYTHGDRLEGFLPGVSLNWMIALLRQFDILPIGVRVFEDPYGPVHDAERFKSYYKPIWRHYRSPMDYHRQAMGAEAPPMKIHQSALDRLAHVFWLDNRFGRCAPRDDTSYPTDSKYRPIRPESGNPLLCADWLTEYGLIKEIGWDWRKEDDRPSSEFPICLEVRGREIEVDEGHVRTVYDGYTEVDGQRCFVAVKNSMSQD